MLWFDQKQVVAQLVDALHYKQEVPGLISSVFLGNFQMTLSLSLHSAALGSTQPLTESHWSKAWPVCTADNSTILVLPNVKVRMDAQHSISPLILLDLLQKKLDTVHHCLRTGPPTCRTLNDVCDMLSDFLDYHKMQFISSWMLICIE